MNYRNETGFSISTILTADEQVRVDAAGAGLYQATHRHDPNEVLADIKNQRASAVLLSVAWCGTADWTAIHQLIRDIPRIPTIALVDTQIPESAETIFLLGKSGVRNVVDVQLPKGWRQLRTLLTEESGDSIELILLQRLRQSIEDMTQECWMFFETILRASRNISSIRKLATRMHVLPSTLMSRFYRAGLPAPKRYLSMARLLRAAFLFENRGFSIANVANHLEYSSPQSFGRHIRGVMGITALEFRHQYSGEAMVGQFESELVEPFEDIFKWFNPLSSRGRAFPAETGNNRHSF